MKHIIVALIAVSGVFCTSCGHNIGTMVHGKFVNIGYDPELNKVGIQYVDGIMATGLQKELSETSLKFTDTADKAGITSTVVEYKTRNGAQVTGYQVDLEKARQEKANDKE